jgi:hypothetical protein
VRKAPSDGYYEEAEKVSIIPAGSRSDLGTLLSVGPGLCKILHLSFREHELPVVPPNRMHSASRCFGEYRGKLRGVRGSRP